jgi:hypothetical protein
MLCRVVRAADSLFEFAMLTLDSTPSPCISQLPFFVGTASFPLSSA